jgi:hypothetical protein
MSLWHSLVMGSTAVKVRGLLIPPGGSASVVEFPAGSSGLQTLIGGRFENVARFPCGSGRVADVWADEEFLLKGLAPNRLIMLEEQEIPILGPIAITAAAADDHPDDEGETFSLSERELAFCRQIVGTWPALDLAADDGG